MMNFTKCKTLSFSFILLLMIIFVISVCVQLSADFTPTSDFEAFLYGRVMRRHFDENDLTRKRTLNIEGKDIVVYLHIQKTGGSSFGTHLVHNLNIKPRCKCFESSKRCDCISRNGRLWLISRHSSGSICGLHADWTEYHDCVEDWFMANDVDSRTTRRYHYISFMRNPVDRFLSEWQHVQRGATWRGARLHCNGRSATIEEVPFCYTADDWRGVTFEEFISCEHNLAFNRITRMLADLTKVNCYNSSGLDPVYVENTLVQSAKENLLSMAFFGLLEYQRATQFLFERTFGINFITDLEQRKRTHVDRIVVTEEMRARVIDSNKLDIYVYQFAKDLFQQRVKAMEDHLGYTVDEYFERVRNVEQTERPSAESLFEDESTQDAEEKALAWYPSKMKRTV